MKVGNENTRYYFDHILKTYFHICFLYVSDPIEIMCLKMTMKRFSVRMRTLWTIFNKWFSISLAYHYKRKYVIFFLHFFNLSCCHHHIAIVLDFIMFRYLFFIFNFGFVMFNSQFDEIQTRNEF